MIKERIQNIAEYCIEKHLREKFWVGYERKFKEFEQHTIRTLEKMVEREAKKLWFCYNKEIHYKWVSDFYDVISYKITLEKWGVVMQEQGLLWLRRILESLERQSIPFQPIKKDLKPF